MNLDEYYREQIRAEIERRGISVNALAKEAGMSETGLRDILSGKIESTTVARLGMIAAALDIPIAKFFDIGGVIAIPGNHEGMSSVLRATGNLVVAGAVQAGVWSEEPPFDPDAEAETIPVGRDARFPIEMRQFALRVKGESINRIAKDGEYVHCVDVQTYREWKDKDFVVVVRERDQGALWEATVKQIEIGADNSVALWPRSDDARYQKPILLEDDGDTQFQLKALVVGVYKPLI